MTIKDPISAKAIEAINRKVMRDGPYRAEIMSGCIPAWYLVKCSPGQENIASAHLSARRFGTFLPTFETTFISRGRKVTHRRLLFNGYIFVFAWDAKEHWRRIRSCPGVMRIECNGEHPVVVSDQDIYHLQIMEVSEGDVRASMVTPSNIGRSAKRPRRGRRREAGHVPAPADETLHVSISTKSYWAGIENLGDADRIGVLHQALGLDSKRLS